MTVYPAISELRLWVPLAVDIFKTYMPTVGKPYPQVHIATARTYPKMRADLLVQTGCNHVEEPEALWSPGQGWCPRYSNGVYEDGRLVVSAGLSNATWIPRIMNPIEVVFLEP